MASPFLIQAGLGLLGGLFGGRARLSPEQRFQMQIARDIARFARSAPLADPLEQAALAQQRAMLGEQQRAFREALFAQMPTGVTTAPADVATGLAAQEISQRMALDAQALLDALQQRRAALVQAAGVAQGVGPRQQEPGLGQTLQELAQQYAAFHTRRRELEALRSPFITRLPGTNIGVSPGRPTTAVGRNIPPVPPLAAGYGIPSWNFSQLLGGKTPDLGTDLASQLRNLLAPGLTLTRPTQFLGTSSIRLPSVQFGGGPALGG